MPPGDCEILRPFCCPADGAAMGAAAPGRDMGKESKEGAAGRGRAGRRGQGFGTPCVRGLRHSLRSGASALPPCASPAALPRYPRISGEPVAPLSPGEPVAPLSPGEPVALPPAPCPPPACVVSVLFVCWAACPGAAAPMAARGSLICVRSGFCSQIRDSQRFVTIFNAQLTDF